MSISLDTLLTIWFLLTAGSLVFVIWDQATNTPTGPVMKLAWILVTIYTGPIGLLLFVFSCRKPANQSHDDFIKAHWKQATGSLLHCVAGDATGIILSAAIVFYFGLPNGLDLIVEYLSAFIVGLFVFQALFMKPMYNGDYWLAVRKTFFAETVSMNMVMLGMIPTMVILMHTLPGADDPFNAEFWAVMSLATMAGMITAYPINSWMVAKKLKHGMMSASKKMDPQQNMAGQMGEKMSNHNDHMDMAHGQHEHHGAALPGSQAAVILLATFALLGMVVWLTSTVAPIRFTFNG